MIHKSLVLKIGLVLLLGAVIWFCSSEKKTPDVKRDVNLLSWPVFRGDNSLSGNTSEPLSTDLELKWKYSTDSLIVSTPVVGGGRVFFTSLDGKVYSLKIIGGEKIWEFDAGDEIEASPLLLDGRLFAGSKSGDLFCLNAADGKVIWKKKLNNSIYGAANYANLPDKTGYLIFVGSYDNMMYCFNSKTGEQVWSYETDNYINGAPATDGTYLVFGGCDEKLHVIRALDGFKFGEVSAGSYIPGSAALLDGRAYLGHYGNKLICITLKDQKIIWEYYREDGDAFFSSPAVGADRVIIGSRDEFLHCVNKKDGRLIWRFKTRDQIDGSPVIAGDKVVFGSIDGRIYILDLNKGREIWSYEVGGSIIGSPAVTGGWIFIGNEDGHLFAFGEK